MKNDERLHKWVNGELSEDELKEFRQRPEYDSLERLRQSLEQLEAPGLREEEMLKAILRAPKQQASRRRLGGQRLMRYAAAAVGLIALVWVFLLQKPTVRQVATNAKEHLEQQLPDGSLAILNAESRLTYEEKGWKDNRVLELEGEAYFDVTHGSSFMVQTATGTVEVLGTQFNVRSRDGELEVSCYTGRVAVVGTAATIETTISGGQAVRLDANGNTVRWEVSTNQRGDHLLQSSRTSLQEVPLSRVLQELQRQYGIVFKTNNVDTNRILSTGFPNDNLEQALQLVFGSLRIRYEMASPTQVNLFQEAE